MYKHLTTIDIVTLQNQELLNSIPFPSDWTKKSIRSIDIKTDRDCIIKINNTDTLLIKKDFGLSIKDTNISSLVVLTQNVLFYAVVEF